MPAVTYPNLGLKAGYSVGEDGWGADMTRNMILTSVIAQASVIDRVAALPGSPADGDVYLLDETDGTNPNRFAIRVDGAWVYSGTPQEGWLAYNQAAGHLEQFDGSVWAEYVAPAEGVEEAPEDGDTYARKDGDWVEISDITVVKYRFGFSIENETPSANEVLLRHVFQTDVDFADDFAGSVGRLSPGGSNPAGTQSFTIAHNGSVVGSMTISTGGVVAFATTGGALSVSAGDELRVEAPGSPDDNIVGVSVTFYGEEA